MTTTCTSGVRGPGAAGTAGSGARPARAVIEVIWRSRAGAV